MTDAARQKLAQESTESVRRMQDFNPEEVARVEELGRELNFKEAVPRVARIVDLFKQVSLDVLPEFSATRLSTLKQTGDAEFNRLQQILTFSPATGNPKQTRDTFLQQLEDGYDAVYEQLWPAIAYSVRRVTDFSKFEREARAALQAVSDRTAQINTEIDERKKEAEAALDAIRTVAAEQGVSQQAIHFKTEADQHSEDAKVWLRRTVSLTILLGVYAVAALVFAKVSWLHPDTAYEAVQLAVGKILVFVTIASAVVLAARNFLAHRHNAIVNRHRQNSLATYKALVEAAGDQANRDIVLAKAAESIFGAQGTGFSKSEASDGAALSLINLAPSLLKTQTTSG